MAFENPKKNSTLALLSWQCRDIETTTSWVDSSVATLNLDVLKPSVNFVDDIATLLFRCRDIELVSPP